MFRASSAHAAVRGLAEVLDEPGEEIPQGGGPVTPAGVLVPILRLATGGLGVVLTRRRAELRRHGGEISFPGGRWDEQDGSLLRTALREAQEEIGLDPQRVSVLGRLEPVLTYVSNYEIWPYVGLISTNEPWLLSPLEVESVLELPLADLRSSRRPLILELPGGTRHTEGYVIGENVIWGATWRILEGLFARLDRAGAVADAP